MALKKMEIEGPLVKMEVFIVKLNSVHQRCFSLLTVWYPNRIK